MHISTPSTRFFATVELLEAVILNLPNSDVLLVQRVSRFWQATISGSSKLQKALYLAPLEESPGDMPWLKPRFSDSTIVRDIYADLFSSMYPLMNPCLATLAPLNDKGYIPFNEKLRRLVNEAQDSSLLKMFVVQPPSPNVMVVCKQVVTWNSGGVIRESWQYGHGYSNHGYVKAEKGVRMKDVLHFVERWVCDHEKKAFSKVSNAYYFAVTGCKMQVNEM